MKRVHYVTPLERLIIGERNDGDVKQAMPGA
jgi:hypothetical protein